MTYFKDPQTYVQQSLLLLSARPKTTRITTTYATAQPAPTKANATSDPAAPTPVPRAVLTLKTYDPISGTTLKFRTDKASEVGRLMTGMRRCGRVMAALPDVSAREKQEVGQTAAAPDQDGQAEQKSKAPTTTHAGQAKPGAKEKRKKGKR